MYTNISIDFPQVDSQSWKHEEKWEHTDGTRELDFTLSVPTMMNAEGGNGLLNPERGLLRLVGKQTIG